MNTATTFYERRHIVDRRIRSTSKVNEKPAAVTERGEVKSASRERRKGLAFDILGVLLAVLTAIAVFSITGLLDGMNSVIGKFGIGGVIIYLYLIMFRHGYYSREID